MFGLTLSPLLTSTHLTVIGGLPVTRRASPIFRFSQTTLASKYSNSLALAILTRSGSRTWPVRSSRYITSEVIWTFMIDPFLSFNLYTLSSTISGASWTDITAMASHSGPACMRPTNPSV